MIEVLSIGTMLWIVDLDGSFSDENHSDIPITSVVQSYSFPGSVITIVDTSDSVYKSILRIIDSQVEHHQQGFSIEMMVVSLPDHRKV